MTNLVIRKDLRYLGKLFGADVWVECERDWQYEAIMKALDRFARYDVRQVTRDLDRDLEREADRG